MTEYRWDAAPTDPIADIRRAMEMHEQRAKRDAIMVPFHNARLDALSRLARARAAEVDRAATYDPTDTVWLCDEHGVIVRGDPMTGGTMPVPMRVPRAVAEFLGAEFRDGMAHLRLGVLAPEVPR